jgi:hypothetical protein
MTLNKGIIVAALLLLVFALGVARADHEPAAKHSEDSITLTYSEQQILSAKIQEIQEQAVSEGKEADYWHGRYDELRACVAKQKVAENAFTVCLGGI